MVNLSSITKYFPALKSIAKKKTDQVSLNYIKVFTSKENLFMYSSDIIRFLIIRTSLSKKVDIDTFIDHESLSSISMMSGDISIKELKRDLVIKSGKRVLKTKKVSPEFFPTIPKYGEKVFNISFSDLYLAISSAIPMLPKHRVGSDVFSGIWFILKENKLEVIATDKKSLIRLTFAIDYPSSIDLVISKEVASTLVLLLDKKDKESTINIFNNGGLISFISKDFSLISPTITGKIPKYKMMFIKTIYEFIVDRKYVLDIIRFIGTSNPESLDDRIEFSIEQDIVAIYSSMSNKVLGEELDVDKCNITKKCSKSMSILFSLEKIKSVFNNIPDDKITIRYNDEVSPMYFIGDNIEIVVMPRIKR